MLEEKQQVKELAQGIFAEKKNRQKMMIHCKTFKVEKDKSPNMIVLVKSFFFLHSKKIIFEYDILMQTSYFFCCFKEYNMSAIKTVEFYKNTEF